MRKRMKDRKIVKESERMTGHWVRDGKRFDTEQEIIDDFRYNVVELDEMDFETYIDDNYRASQVAYMVVHDGPIAIEEIRSEMYDDYMRKNQLDICEGEDVVNDWDDYIWVEDEDDDSDREYEAKRDWELDHKGE